MVLQFQVSQTQIGLLQKIGRVLLDTVSIWTQTVHLLLGKVKSSQPLHFPHVRLNTWPSQLQLRKPCFLPCCQMNSVLDHQNLSTFEEITQAPLTLWKIQLSHSIQNTSTSSSTLYEKSLVVVSLNCPMSLLGRMSLISWRNPPSKWSWRSSGDICSDKGRKLYLYLYFGTYRCWTTSSVGVLNNVYP